MQIFTIQTGDTDLIYYEKEIFSFPSDVIWISTKKDVGQIVNDGAVEYVEVLVIKPGNYQPLLEEAVNLEYEFAIYGNSIMARTFEGNEAFSLTPLTIENYYTYSSGVSAYDDLKSIQKALVTSFYYTYDYIDAIGFANEILKYYGYDSDYGKSDVRILLEFCRENLNFVRFENSSAIYHYKDGEFVLNEKQPFINFSMRRSDVIEETCDDYIKGFNLKTEQNEVELKKELESNKTLFNLGKFMGYLERTYNISVNFLELDNIL